MSDGAVQIQSFRVVFDLERRIHRIDRFKIPMPYGLPLRSVGYSLAALAVILIIGGLPVVGAPVAALPSPLRLVLIPVGVAVLLTRLRIDGRSAHAACAAWLTFRLQPRHLVAFAPGTPTGLVRFGDLCVAAEPQPSKKAQRRWPWRWDRRSPEDPTATVGRSSEQLRLVTDDQLGLW